MNYNPLAASKYAALGRVFLPGDDTERFTRAQMERFGQVGEENGIEKLILGD